MHVIYFVYILKGTMALKHHAVTNLVYCVQYLPNDSVPYLNCTNSLRQLLYYVDQVISIILITENKISHLFFPPNIHSGLKQRSTYYL